MQMQNWSSKGHGDNKVVSKENDSIEYMQEVLKKCKKQADEIERKKKSESRPKRKGITVQQQAQQARNWIVSGLALKEKRNGVKWRNEEKGKAW